MKKIFSTFIICLLLISNLSLSYAQEEYNGQYKNYIPKIQAKIDAMNSQEIEVFQRTLADIIIETNNGELSDFLKTVLLLTKKSETQTESTPISQNNTQIEEIISSGNDTNIVSLSSSEQRKIAGEITNMQKSLNSEATNMLNKVLVTWNELSRYTERGDLRANMDLNFENIMQLQAGIDISEYFAENQSFDSALRADIEGFYTSNSIFLGEIDISGKTNLEFIQKGSDMYLLMKNTQLNSNNEAIEISLTPMIEVLNELADDNTFISFSDESSIDMYKLLDYFDAENMQAELDMIFSQNLMQAYGKNQQGYLLKPTKHFCDIGKRLMNVFDPFNGKECSEKQYENMLEDFYDSGIEIIMQTGNELSLRITNENDPDAYELINIDFLWKNASFTEMGMSISQRDKNEYITIQYLSDELIKVFIQEQEYNPSVLLNIQIGRNGSIKNIDFTSGYKDEYTLEGTYKNGALNVVFEADIPEMQASCNLSGQAYSSYLDIVGNCDIYSPEIDTDSQNISINSSLKYIGGTSQNNFSWTFEGIADENNYLNFDITSQAKRQSTGSYEIQIPSNTIDYLEFLEQTTPEDSYYFDDYELDYEYDYNTYEDYDEACYTYESGDKTCYKYYDDRDVTCEFNALTQKETCEEFKYDF